jgi:integrase
MFIDETSKKNQWTFATHQKFNALKKHLNEWRRKISFDDFTERGFNDFIAFLRDKKQMKNSTIGNQISFVKWFLRWVTLKGYNTNIAFQTFSPKLKTAQKHVVFLDWNELMKVFNYIVPNNGDEITLHDANGKEYKKIVHDAAAIAKARDIFCFCCFTSLRYSDAANLKRANLNGESLTITTIKTADTITVEINKYARAILDKYAERDDLGGYVFPAITNQRMNIYLKELCELCEINQPITQTYYRGAERIDETMPKYEMIGTHTGRRTFICNALMLGIPAEIVMKWTGHADYKSMKPYIDVTNNAKANAMNLFNKL